MNAAKCLRVALLVAVSLSICSTIGAQYCDYNVTSIRETVVMKTRRVAKEPTGVFKMFKKRKILLETFPDTERVEERKLVRRCCDGYERNTLQMCVPVCEEGCPTNARCIEPNLCTCAHGYGPATSPVDGKRHCRAICREDCPANSHCALPNVCHCNPGYHLDQSAHQDGVELCESDVETLAGTSELPTSDSEFATEHSDISDENVEESDRIYLDPQSATEVSDADDYVTDKTNLFPSNEVDCQVRACPEHAKCQQNGSCACDDGFVWHKINATILTEGEVTPQEIAKYLCVDIAEASELLIVDGENQDWIILLVVGVVSVLAIVIVLALLKYASQRRGKHTVQPQNDLSFQYKTDSANDSGMLY